MTVPRYIPYLDFSSPTARTWNVWRGFISFWRIKPLLVELVRSAELSKTRFELWLSGHQNRRRVFNQVNLFVFWQNGYQHREVLVKADSSKFVQHLKTNMTKLSLKSPCAKLSFTHYYYNEKESLYSSTWQVITWFLKSIQQGVWQLSVV